MTATRTPVDLDAIRDRQVQAFHGGSASWLIARDVPALVAEVEALRAERDQLVNRVQRLWSVILQGGQDGESIRRALLSEMTPGELLQMRRADPVDGVS